MPPRAESLHAVEHQSSRFFGVAMAVEESVAAAVAAVVAGAAAVAVAVAEVAEPGSGTADVAAGDAGDAVVAAEAAEAAGVAVAAEAAVVVAVEAEPDGVEPDVVMCEEFEERFASNVVARAGAGSLGTAVGVEPM